MIPHQNPFVHIAASLALLGSSAHAADITLSTGIYTDTQTYDNGIIGPGEGNIVTFISGADYSFSGNLTLPTAWNRITLNSGAWLNVVGNLSGDVSGVSLNGGTLTTGSLLLHDSPNWAGTLNDGKVSIEKGDSIINGSTVVANQSNANFISMAGGTGATNGWVANNLWLGNDAATIHSNGFDIGITMALGNFSGQTGKLTKMGTGTLTLSAANTYTGTTTISAGTLRLDFSAAGAPTDNIINNSANSSALSLGSGVLEMVGKDSATHSQRFNGVSVSGGGSIGFISGSSGTLDVSLGGVTRSGAGTLDITLPTSGTIAATVPGTNNGVVVDAGGSWANFVTVNDGQTWAGMSGDNIVAFNSYTPNDFGNHTTHTDITANMSSGAATTGDIRFDTDDVTLTLSDALNVDAGGILVTPNTATNGVTITGGSLSGNGGAKKLAFFNYGKLTVGSLITGTANGVTFTGTGTTTLTGANIYSGLTTVSGCTLTLSGSGTLGAGALSLKTGTLNLGTTTQTLGGNLNAGGTGNGAVGTISNGTIHLNGKDACLQSGTYTMNLTGGGASRLWIGGDATATVELGGINTSTYSDNNSTIIGYLPVTGAAGTVKLLSGTALGPNGQNAQVHTGTLDLNGQTVITGNSIALYGTSKMVNSDTATAASYAGTVDFGGFATPSIGGAGNITLSGSLINGGFTKTGPGTLTLLGANNYSGDTMIDGGTLALSGSATLPNTANIVVAGGATLDVSGLSSPLALGTGRPLRNRGEATAALKGDIDASVGELAISFQSGVPAFTIGGGTLTLSSSTVVQISGTFAVGTYRLINPDAGGSVAGSLPALSLFRATGYLQLSAGGLDLVVTSGDPFNYHITPTGDDTTGDGTSAAPWQSITKVRDHLRTLDTQSDDITVNLSGGHYELADTLAFTPADSGKNGHYITYQSKPGEQASITGGRRVTGWTPVPGKPYWVASVPTSAGFADYFRQLYVNGIRAERARSAWINGVGYFDDPGTTHAIDGITFNTSELKAYTNVSDLRLSHFAAFKIDEFPITAVIDDPASGLTKIRLQQPYCQTRYNRGGGSFEPTDEWMIVQAFEELDEPGEWYHDRTTDQVFYYPNSFEDMTTAQVDAPAVDTLMRFTGTSTTNKVSNIRIQNLILEHGNWLFPRDYYIGGGQAEIIHGAASPTAGGAPVNFEIPGQIVLNNTLDLQFIGNTIRHQGACGIQVYDGARNTLIQGNRFLDLTAAAVIGGRYNHSATQEICHNTLISNNVIRNTGSDFMGATLVNNLGHTAFQVVHNDMADAPYCGFHQRTDSGLGGGNGGTVVSFNKVSLGNTGGRYGVGDSAYIYTFGEWPGSTVEGNDINTINVPNGDNGNISGFYLDNSSYGLNIIGNVMRGIRPGGMGYKFVRAWNNDPTVNSANGNYGDSTVNWWQVLSDPNYHQMTLGQPLPEGAQAIVDSAGLEPAYASLIYQVYGGTDLARGKTATASSQWDTNTPASSAVDWNYGSIWHQASGDPLPWWSVDLGSAYVIQRIEISPRTDMDQPDSRCNFQVQGSNDSNFSEFTVLAEQNEVAFPYRRTGWSNSWIRFVNNPSGFRYLRVKKTSSGGLNFSDFQVFGYSAGFNHDGLLWDSSASGEKTDGGGNWSAANQWWSDAGNQSWVNGGDATFGNGKGAAGTIVIDGTGASANSLSFTAATSGNYAITGGPLALDGPNINTSLGLNPVIASSLSGTSGLIKSGQGSLTLSGNNTFTGGVTINAGTLSLGNAGALNVTTPNNVTVSSGAFAINGNDITVPTLSVTGGAFVQNGASSDATLTMNSGNITGFRDGGTGKLAVLVTNNITLNSSNTFTGGLWIKNGFIGMQPYSSFGNGTVTLGDTSGNANILLAAQTSGNWGNAITIESGGTGSVTLNCFGGYSPTLSGPINLKKTFNVYNNSNNASSRTITLSGKISGSSGLYLYANRNGDLNRIALSNAASDFTGPITINSGVVYVNSIANGGEASSIGASTNAAANLVFDGGTLKYNGSSHTTSDRAFTINGGKTAFIDTAAYDLSFAGATGTATNGALHKTGAGTLTLTGAQTYTGLTTVADGTLKNGSDSTFTSKGALALAEASAFDLNGFNAGFTDVNSSFGTATITDNGMEPGTSTFALSAQGSTNSALIIDGPTRKLAVSLTNENGSGAPFSDTSANTFSGGLFLLDSGNGTRLRVSATVTTTGSADAITSSPFGTGPIYIGQAATDMAGILIDTVNDIAIANDLVFNTARGTDFEGFRLDTIGNLLSGKITANLADATFATGSTNTGAVTLSGQVTGTQGLALRAVTAGWLTVTLDNAGTASDYTGNTSVGFGGNGRNTLVLARADQIPNGAGKGNVSVNGTLNMNGFNETINGLTGSGSVDALSGSPTLTIGDGDATGNTFSGMLKNTGGALAVTKIGNGTQTLSGANTYTGATTVNAGTLALAGGSQASAITVNNAGTSLGFTLGSSVSSSSSVTFNAGTTVKIVGAPTLASYTLMTAPSFLGIAPVLDSPIAGYALSVAGGNTLMLIQTVGYSSWASDKGLDGSNNGTLQDPNNNGISNLMEYVLNGEPLLSKPLTSILPILDASGANFVFTFTCREESASDTTQVFQFGSELDGWTPLSITAPTAAEVSLGTPSGGLRSVTITIPKSLASGGKLFGRLHVVKIP